MNYEIQERFSTGFAIGWTFLSKEIDIDDPNAKDLLVIHLLFFDIAFEF